MANPIEGIKNRTDNLLYSLIERPFLTGEKKRPELTEAEKAAMTIGNAQDLFDHLHHYLAGHDKKYLQSLYGGQPRLSRLQASPSIWELMDELGVKTSESLLMIFAMDLFRSETQLAEIFVPQVRHQQGHQVPAFLRQRGRQNLRADIDLEPYRIGGHYFGFQTIHRYFGEVGKTEERLTFGALRLNEIDIPLPESKALFEARMSHFPEEERNEFIPSDHSVKGWEELSFVRYKLPDWSRFSQVPPEGVIIDAFAVGMIDQRMLFFDDVDKPEKPAGRSKLPKLKVMPTGKNELTITAIPARLRSTVDLKVDIYPQISMAAFIGADQETVDFFQK